MTSSLEHHIQLVENVNRSEDEATRHLRMAELRGFRSALELLGFNGQLSECAMYYIRKGVDRPMCCGVFLDWEPKITT